MIIRKVNTKGTWFKYEGKVEFLIRPFKFSKFDLKDISAGLMEQLVFSVLDWKGLLEEDNETIFKCNDKNKEYIYDYHVDLREFVFEKLKELHDSLGKDLKN